MTDRETAGAAALAMTLSLPLWCWICLPSSAPLQVLCLTGVTMLLVLPALLQRWVLVRLRVRNLFVQYLVSVGLAAAAGAAMWPAARRMLPPFPAAGAAILMALSLRTACRLVRTDADRLLSVNFPAAAGTIWFLSWVLCLLQRQSLPGWCLWGLGIQMALYAAMRSRHSLLHAAGGTPTGACRVHNALMLAVCIGVPAGIMLGAGPLVEGLRTFLVRAGSLLGQFLRWLLLVLFGRELLAPQEDVLPQQETPGTDRVLAWAGMLTTVLTAGAAVFLLWRFRHELLDFLASVRYHLFLTIRALLRRREPERMHRPAGEYTDSVELLEAGSAAHPVKGAVSWRRQLRRFRREKDPVMQYRMGYALWLRALREWGIGHAPGDPPGAICEKAQGAPDPALTAQVTQDYYLVRYAQIPPTPEQTARMKALVERTAKGM